MSTPFVKICGVRNPETVAACIRYGARAVGVNFVKSSKRYIGSMYDASKLIHWNDDALIELEWAGVFVNEPLDDLKMLEDDLDLDTIQLHGDESPDYVRAIREYAPHADIWKAFRVSTADDLKRIPDYECDGWVLDAKEPGSGVTFDWDILQSLPRTTPIILSGGLNPVNVAEAIRRVEPDWVDVASGVESAPGVKSAAIIEAFMKAVKYSVD